jgi:hypothetical protein
VSSTDPNLLVLFRPIPKTRYRGAVEVKRAADLYAQGWDPAPDWCRARRHGDDSEPSAARSRRHHASGRCVPLILLPRSRSWSFVTKA